MYQFKLRFSGTGTQPKVVPDYFERGDLVHTMLEQLYKLKKYRSNWKLNKKTYQDVVQSCITVGRHKARKMSIDIIDIENVVTNFISYCDFWENDGWDNIKFIEQTGAKILYEDDNLVVLYEVKIDLGVILSGRLTPVDHKSTKARKDPNVLSNQFKGYCWFTGTNEMIENDFGLQKTLAPAQKFIRQRVSFSDSQLLEWKENAIWWIRWAVDLMNKDQWPQNFTSCDKYAGCLYKEVCKADPDIRDFKLQQFFKAKGFEVGKDNL